MQIRLPFLSSPIPRAALGPRGEQRALWYYRIRGWRLLERNLRTRRGEVDLVLRRGSTIVIAEVKSRQSLAAGEGWEAVDREKRERMIRMGERIAARHPEAQLRYDVVSLFWTGRRFVVTHFADAFRPVADSRYPWVWRG